MVVVVLILASFCYFYLFNLARTSDIFSGTVTRLYPTSVYAAGGASAFEKLDRTTSDLSLPFNALKIQLKQISVSDPNRETVMRHDTLLAVTRLQNFIEKEILVPDTATTKRYAYNPDLCYKVDDACFLQSPLEFWKTMATEDSEQSIILSFAFNTTGAYRQHLADLWEHKVMTLVPGDLVSLSSISHQDNIFSWMFIIVRNVVIRIKELIEASMVYYPYSMTKRLPQL